MTSGAVNQIVNPNSAVRPSPTTLRLLEVLGELKKGSNAAGPTLSGEAWANDLVAKLRAMEPGKRDQLVKAFEAIIVAAG